VGYAEDIDRLRDYVRATGYADYRRMREIEADCVEVQFIENVERHAAAIADLLDEPQHVRVVRADSDADRAERAERYWASRREEIVRSIDDEAITAIGFGYDDRGEPLVFIGVLPFTPEVAARVTQKLAPHRVRVDERPRVTLLGSAFADL
jgi:hypothetical protein